MGIIAVGFIAGCGSTSHNSQGSTSATTPSTSGATSSATAGSGGSASSSSCNESGVRGVTGSQINVAGLVSVLDFGTSVGKAAEARFNEANASNELPCGRKIKYVTTIDDQATEAGNLTAVRTLVQEDNVFAISPTVSPFLGSGSGTYINQQKVPTTGWGIGGAFCPAPGTSNVYLFVFNGCLTESPPTYSANIPGPSTAAAIKGQGKNPQGMTAAVIGDDYAASKSGVATVGSSLASAGFKVVYAQTPFPSPPAVVADFSPEVQALMTANAGKPVDVVYSASGPATAFPLCRALFQAGFKGICEHSTYDPSLVATAKGDYVVETFATTESTVPAMIHIASLLKAAGVTNIGAPALTGYYAADMFVQILKKVGPDLTPQNFQKAAQNFVYQIPGVVGPTYYPQGFQQGAPCGEMLYSNGVKWTLPAPYECFGQNLKLENGKYVEVPYPGSS